ncbi:hypothetical protein [Acidihalobacter aeolianus]|nr:hypothetical protein [Acidihalobacter aeolianus]
MTEETQAPFLFLLHGDGMAAGEIHHALALLNSRPGSRLVVATAPGSAAFHVCTKAKDSGQDVRLVDYIHSEVRGQVREAFVFELGRLLNNPTYRQHVWVIFSRRPEVRAMADVIASNGIERVVAFAEPTTDALEALSGDDEQSAVTHILLGLFWSNYRQRNGDLHIGDFAFLAQKAIPSLGNPLERRRLFGSKRFNSIAQRIGLSVSHGGQLHPQGETGESSGVAAG